MQEGTQKILYGTLCLIVCCLFYLIWWSITFHPARTFPSAPKSILFACTLAAGLGGIALLLIGIRELPAARGQLSNLTLAVIGIAAYVILLLVSNRLLHRQVTTELLLIVGWTVLELCVLNSLYRAGGPALPAALVYGILTIAAAVIGLLCYLAYYNLEAMRGFYNGMVPLILFAVIMALQLPLIHSCLSHFT